MLEKAIAKRFYLRLGLSFSDDHQKTLVDYVEEAKVRLQSRSASTERQKSKSLLYVR